MNLASAIIYAGGPGSGCNPEVGKCGRPPGSGSRDAEEIKLKQRAVQVGQPRDDVQNRLYKRGYKLDPVRSKFYNDSKQYVVAYTKGGDRTYYVTYDDDNKVISAEKVTTPKPATGETTVLPPVKNEPTSLTDQPVEPASKITGTVKDLADMFKDAGAGFLQDNHKVWVAHAIEKMAAANLHPSLIGKLTAIVSEKTRGASGTYLHWVQRITLGDGANADTVIHEYGHHIDYAMVGRGDKLTTEGRKLYDQTIDEWANANDQVARTIGMPFGSNSVTSKEENEKWYVARSRMWMVKSLPAVSHYAMYNHKEWIAESFTKFIRNPKFLERKAPETYKFFSELNKGKLLK